MSLDKKQIQKSFSRAASSYADAAVVQQHVAEQIIQRLQFIKLEPQTVIDLGAGPGDLSLQLQTQYPEAKVYALDFAWGMAQAAKEQGLHSVCADAYQLPLATNSVDCVVSHCMLQWCDDYVQVLQEVKRVLRPQGLFLFSTLGPDTFQELRASWAHVDDRIHVHDFIDMHHIGDELLRTQFVDPVMDCEFVTLHYSELKKVWQDLRATGVQNRSQQRMRGLLGKHAWQQFCDAYAGYCTAEGKYPLTYEIIYGHAWASDTQLQTHDADTNEISIPIEQIQRS